MCNLSSPCLTWKKNKCYIKYLRMSKVDWPSSFLCKKFKVPTCKFSWIRMSVRCCILCKLSQNIPPNPSQHRVETEGNTCTQLKTDFFPTADDVFSRSQSQVSQSHFTSQSTRIVFAHSVSGSLGFAATQVNINNMHKCILIVNVGTIN